MVLPRKFIQKILLQKNQVLITMKPWRKRKEQFQGRVLIFGESSTGCYCSSQVFFFWIPLGPWSKQSRSKKKTKQQVLVFSCLLGSKCLAFYHHRISQKSSSRAMFLPWCLKRQWKSVLVSACVLLIGIFMLVFFPVSKTVIVKKFKN